MITTIRSLICPSASIRSPTAPVTRLYLMSSRPTWRRPRVALTVNRPFTIGTHGSVQGVVTGRNPSARVPRRRPGIAGSARQAIQVIFTRQRVERWGFDPELLYLARKYKLKTVEVPVE